MREFGKAHLEKFLAELLDLTKSFYGNEHIDTRWMKLCAEIIPSIAAGLDRQRREYNNADSEQLLKSMLINISIAFALSLVKGKDAVNEAHQAMFELASTLLGVDQSHIAAFIAKGPTLRMKVSVFNVMAAADVECDCPNCQARRELEKEQSKPH